MLIKNLVQYIKQRKMLDKIYAEERVLVNLGRLFKAEFRQDWIGRVYTVINPALEGADPVSGSSTQIYEFMPDGTLSENMWVEKWVMDKMNILSSFIKNNNLFELADYELTRLDDKDNWLFVIMPLQWKDLKRSIKRFLITAGILAIAAVAAIIIL